MIAREFFVQVPPDAFDGIRLWGIRWQEVDLNAMAPAVQERLHQTAVVELGIVTDHMNAAIASQVLAV